MARCKHCGEDSRFISEGFNRLTSENRKLRDHIKRLQEAVGLLNSMVLSGESHSERSHEVVQNAVREA